MTKPSTWLLNLNESFGRHCDETLSKLECLFLESSQWLEAIRKAEEEAKANELKKKQPITKKSRKPTARTRKVKEAAPVQLPAVNQYQCGISIKYILVVRWNCFGCGFQLWVPDCFKEKESIGNC